MLTRKAYADYAPALVPLQQQDSGLREFTHATQTDYALDLACATICAAFVSQMTQTTRIYVILRKTSQNYALQASTRHMKGFQTSKPSEMFLRKESSWSTVSCWRAVRMREPFRIRFRKTLPLAYQKIRAPHCWKLPERPRFVTVKSNRSIGVFP